MPNNFQLTPEFSKENHESDSFAAHWNDGIDVNVNAGTEEMTPENL